MYNNYLFLYSVQKATVFVYSVQKIQLCKCTLHNSFLCLCTVYSSQGIPVNQQHLLYINNNSMVIRVSQCPVNQQHLLYINNNCIVIRVSQWTSNIFFTTTIVLLSGYPSEPATSSLQQHTAQQQSLSAGTKHNLNKLCIITESAKRSLKNILEWFFWKNDLRQKQNRALIYLFSENLTSFYIQI